MKNALSALCLFFAFVTACKGGKEAPIAEKNVEATPVQPVQSGHAPASTGGAKASFEHCASLLTIDEVKKHCKKENVTTRVGFAESQKRDVNACSRDFTTKKWTHMRLHVGIFDSSGYNAKSYYHHNDGKGLHKDETPFQGVGQEARSYSSMATDVVDFWDGPFHVKLMSDADGGSCDVEGMKSLAKNVATRLKAYQ